MMMAKFSIARTFDSLSRETKELQDLWGLLAECTHAMGFRYFALTQHIDFAAAPSQGIRLHNYPAAWQQWFDERSLGRFDPIHRASHVTSAGFARARVPNLIRLTPGDRDVLEQARRIGIGDGFTVPAHVPGEQSGSCSFAVGPGDEFPGQQILVAQLIGDLAFENARRLSQPRIASQHTVLMTDRQRDCVLWAARGKTDWEISRILGVSHDTVIQHLKHARERYGVQKRAHLAVMALYDGSISFSDIFTH